MEFLIITIHKGPIHNLINTLNSIDQQSIAPDLNVVVSPFISDEIQSLYTRTYRKFVIGKDKSLYNAMNIGLNYSHNFYTLFLNSGDSFFSYNSIENLRKFSRMNSTNIFRTILKSKSYFFFPRKEFIAHSAFIRPPDSNPIFFNESQNIVADGDWMIENLRRFSHCRHDIELTVFNLDGVSSIPTLQSVASKFHYKAKEGLKEFIKFIIFNITFKTEIYFLIIYFFKYEFKKI